MSDKIELRETKDYSYLNELVAMYRFNTFEPKDIEGTDKYIYRAFDIYRDNERSGSTCILKHGKLFFVHGYKDTRVRNAIRLSFSVFSILVNIAKEDGIETLYSAYDTEDNRTGLFLKKLCFKDIFINRFDGRLYKFVKLSL